MNMNQYRIHSVHIIPFFVITIGLVILLGWIP